MSGFAREWAWNRKGLSPTEKCVLMSLCDFHTEKNGCFPSLKLISETVNVGQDTVVRILGALEEKGLIKKINRFRENGGKKSNFYQINFTPIAVPDPFQQSDTPILDNPIYPSRIIQHEHINKEHSDTTYQADPIFEISNQEPPDDNAVFWAEATALAEGLGLPPKKSGPIIGKMLKLTKGDRDGIIRRLETGIELGVENPTSWIMGMVVGAKKKVKEMKNAQIDAALKKLEEEHERLKAEWESNATNDGGKSSGGDNEMLQFEPFGGS